MSQILKYVGYTKPTLAMYVLHNLHGQLSQYHGFNISLHVDREISSIIELQGKILSVDPFLLIFF